MKMPQPIRQLFDLEKQEFRIVSLSAIYFFLLLCAYYVLRPIRETMGISRSADDLPYLFLGTMVTMLLLAPVIGGLVSKYKRSEFIPIVYRFIIICLLLFFTLLSVVSAENLFYVGVIFYVWLSVMNMLIISLFWGFMSDGISFKNSKRLFPSIAIGGTIGAIFGSTIAQQFIDLLGQTYLLLVSAILFEVAARVMKKIDQEFDSYPQTPARLGESLTKWKIDKNSASKLSQWTSGIRFAISSPYILGIAGYIFCYGITSTFLYFQQGQLVAAATESSTERTQIFANIDIWSNAATLALQLFISRQLLMKFGIGFILLGLPLLTLSGFVALSIAPTLAVLIIFQATRRSLNYGLFKPAREILFTILPQEQKYKAKSFVDTFVYRGGDAIGAITQKGLTAIQLGIGSIALLVVPIAAFWSLLAIYLGKQANRIAEHESHSNQFTGEEKVDE
ncbi:NTP/NDP exchange transporter [Aliikangiella coralliicola]|uniref:ADP,ATP carrier protein n=1 Tax=Aliikangiella coralliicola TaxID=2592383 RepID=A0A545UF34_9GAMM|nr:Npt1/Npt2 family nucleotide transporter [Aliikangiella coralliicola]TQV88089.1 MFS transporter [Aliikangiella coralliicola]